MDRFDRRCRRRSIALATELRNGFDTYTPNKSNQNIALVGNQYEVNGEIVLNMFRILGRKRLGTWYLDTTREGYTMLMSLKDYARWRCVSVTSVYKAVNRGRIERRDDGMIEVIAADEAWDANTNPAMQREYHREAVPIHLPEHVYKVKDLDKSLREFPAEWEAALQKAFPSLRFD